MCEVRSAISWAIDPNMTRRSPECRCRPMAIVSAPISSATTISVSATLPTSNQTRRPSVAFAGRLDQRHGQAALGSLRQKRDRFLAKPFGLHVSHQRRIGCSRAGHGDKGQSRAQGKGQIGCPLGRDTCRGRAIDAAEDMGDPSAHDSQA